MDKEKDCSIIHKDKAVSIIKECLEEDKDIELIEKASKHLEMCDTCKTALHEVFIEKFVKIAEGILQKMPGCWIIQGSKTHSGAEAIIRECLKKEKQQNKKDLIEIACRHLKQCSACKSELRRVFLEKFAKIVMDKDQKEQPYRFAPWIFAQADVSYEVIAHLLKVDQKEVKTLISNARRKYIAPIYKQLGVIVDCEEFAEKKKKDKKWIANKPK